VRFKKLKGSKHKLKTLNMNSECIHQCLDCKEKFPRTVSVCPNCGSENLQDFFSVHSELKLRSGIKVTLGDKSTGITYKQVSREELGRDGKEAKNTMIFDFKNNKYLHSVRKQDENGVWKETHKDDEPLSEHNKKAELKNKLSKKA
jgi:hypothetical protein